MYSDTELFFLIQRRKGPFKMPVAHFHNHHELYFLISGETKYFVNGKIYILSAGDVIFIPKGVFHQTSYPYPENIERLTITFNDQFAGEEFSSHISALSDCTHLRIPKTHINFFNSLLMKLEAENVNRLFDYENMQKLYMRQLLIMLFRYCDKPHIQKLGSSYELAQSAANYINANYSQPLTLESMAKKYFVSSNYFSKIFKKATGIGFSEYLNITRISAAQELLANTSMNSTEIAFKCGFNDSNYFIQVFKKIHGITPKKYSMQFK